jgi:hypothetical protein
MLRDHLRAEAEAEAARELAGEARDENGCTRAEVLSWRAQHRMLWELIESAVTAAPNPSEAARRAELLRYELLELRNRVNIEGHNV